MRMRTIAVGPLAANCHILWTDPQRALVVDPGADGARLVEALRAEGVRPALVAVTHGHFDHTGAVGDLVREFAVPFKLNRSEVPIVEMTPPGTRLWGIEVAAVPKASGYLEHGQVLDLAGLRVEAIHTPGHTPGSTCFYVADAGLVLTGDTLFQRSVGRSDFPGGDAQQLAESIQDRLYSLPGETVVHPGHGPTTTIQEERRENPFVRA